MGRTLSYYLRTLGMSMLIALWVMLVVALSGVICRNCQGPTPTPALAQQRDTIIVHDTLYIDAPTPRDSVRLCYVYRTLLRADTLTAAANSATATPTDNADSVRVEVPICYLTYADTDYVAYVSGYEARLDSLRIFRTMQQIRSTETRRTSRWSVGVTAGYGCTTAGLQPFVGIALSYRLFEL